MELRPGSLLALARHVALQQRLDGCRQPLHGFGTGDQVEGDRKCPSLFKIREPEFGARKLPLDVRVILRLAAREIALGDKKNINIMQNVSV